MEIQSQETQQVQNMENTMTEIEVNGNGSDTNSTESNPSTSDTSMISAGSTNSNSSLSSGSGYDFEQALEIRLHEKLLTVCGDSFQIRRMDNQKKLFRLKKHTYSISSKKTLYATDDRTAIYTMCHNVLAIRERMHILHAKSLKKAFTLRKIGFVPYQGIKSIDVWQGEKSEGLPYVRVEGDFFKREYEMWIREGQDEKGRLAAKVGKKQGTVGDVLLNRETFVLSVEKGVDVALVVMLATAIAEHWQR